MSTIGKKITTNEARELILNYSTELNRDKESWAWAELFSIEIIEEFMANVAIYNKTNPEAPIKYARFYYGRKKPAQPGDDKPDDLVIIGAINKNNDVPNLNLPTLNGISRGKSDSGEDDGGGTYGNGAPCPNACESGE